jgi:hypothetical protein
MAMGWVRTNQLWNRPGRPGLLGCGKTKVNEDFLLRDATDPHVPDTDVPRIKVHYLGPKIPIVEDTEVERFICALTAFLAGTQRTERDHQQDADATAT